MCIKNQEEFWCGKWWGLGAFHFVLSISFMSISWILGFGVLLHFVGHSVSAYLDYSVLFWNKFGAFYVSCICLWTWLIWTMKDFVVLLYSFSWRERHWSLCCYRVYWSLIESHGELLQQFWSLVSLSQRQPESSLFRIEYGDQGRVTGYIFSSCSEYLYHKGTIISVLCPSV